MNEQDHIKTACISVWGEAGTAEMEAHCAANGMTLGDFLEALATAPGGVADRFGVHVDHVTGRELATVLQAGRLLEQTQTLRAILSPDPAAMFQGRA